MQHKYQVAHLPCYPGLRHRPKYPTEIQTVEAQNRIPICRGLHDPTSVKWRPRMHPKSKSQNSGHFRKLRPRRTHPRMTGPVWAFHGGGRPPGDGNCGPFSLRRCINSSLRRFRGNFQTSMYVGGGGGRLWEIWKVYEEDLHSPKAPPTI